MSAPRRIGSLELDEDPNLQAGEWRSGRITWIALLALVLTTALGLFGGGWLSDTRAGQPGDPIWVDYARFGRYGASMRLIVHVTPSPDAMVPLTLDRSLLDAFRIQAITPNPHHAELLSNGVRYTFAGSPDAGSPDAGGPDAGGPDAGGPDAGGPDAGATQIIFELQPAKRWLIRGAVGSSDRVVRLAQFIYP